MSAVQNTCVDQFVQLTEISSFVGKNVFNCLRVGSTFEEKSL